MTDNCSCAMSEGSQRRCGIHGEDEHLITFESREEWFDTSMVVYMITSLLNGIYRGTWSPTDDEYNNFGQWYDDVDMCTGAFGK